MEVDNLDIDKLVLVPVDFSKLPDVVKKKTEYNKLVTKVDNTDTINFVKKKLNVKKMDQSLKIKSIK